MSEFLNEVFAALNIEDPTLKQAESFKQVMNKFYPSAIVESSIGSSKLKGRGGSSKSKSSVKSMTYTRYVALMLSNKEKYVDFFNMELSLTVDNLNTIFSKLSEPMQKVWSDIEDESKEGLSECSTLNEFYEAIASAFKSLQQKKSVLVGILTFINFKIPTDSTLVEETSSSSSAHTHTSATVPMPSVSDITTTKPTKEHKQRKTKDSNKRGLDFFRKFISGVNKGLFTDNESEVAEIKKFYSNYSTTKTPLIRMNNLFNSLNDKQKEYYNTFFTEYPELDNEEAISKMLVGHQTELVEKFHEFFLSATETKTETEAETEAETEVETEPETRVKAPVSTQKKISLKH